MMKGISISIFIFLFLIIGIHSKAQINMDHGRFCKSFQSIFNYVMISDHLCDSVYYYENSYQCPELPDYLRLFGMHNFYYDMQSVEYVMYSSFIEQDCELQIEEYLKFINGCLEPDWAFSFVNGMGRPIYFLQHKGERHPEGTVSLSYIKAHDVYEIRITFLK